jgi:2'-5' RNA ligase
MEIKRIQESLPEFIGNKTKLPNLHLTLKFLGEIPFEKVEKIKEILKKINFNKFEAEIKEIGFFDKLKSGIIWLSLTNCEKIQKEIDEVLALNGLCEKEKRFMSHLTIARTKKIKDKKLFLENLNKVNLPKMFFIVESFYLIQSKLKKESPEYNVLEEYSLK